MKDQTRICRCTLQHMQSTGFHSHQRNLRPTNLDRDLFFCTSSKGSRDRHFQRPTLLIRKWSHQKHATHPQACSTLGVHVRCMFKTGFIGQKFLRHILQLHINSFRKASQNDERCMQISATPILRSKRKTPNDSNCIYHHMRSSDCLSEAHFHTNVIETIVRKSRSCLGAQPQPGR